MAGSELQPEATAPTGTGPRGDIPIRPGVDYRQVQQPFELKQPWHIPASGAATEAEDLAHALKGFSKEADAFGTKLNSQAGKAAGAQAGLDPGFQPKTGLAAVTAFGQNYNAAAHVVYVANTQTSVESMIDQAEQAYPHDPIGFQAHVQQVRDAMLKETPSLYQPEVQTMLDRRIEAGHNRIAEATIKQGQQDGVAAYTGTEESRIKTAVRTAADLPADKATATIQQALYDNSKLADGLVASNAISKERAVTLKQEFQDKITEQVHTHHAESVAGNWIDTARTTQDLPSADRALAAYVSDPANSNDDKARVGAEYARQREAFEHQQGALHAPEVQKLSDYITQIPGEKEGRGGFGPGVEASINNMRTKGWITTEYARSLSERAAHNSAKGQVDDADSYNVDKVMHGEADKFDPKDPRAGKAVDTYFKTVTAANGFAKGTDGYNNLAVSVMAGTSVVPPVIRKGIIADISSGDYLKAAAAARLQERLHAANPAADIYQEDAKAMAQGHVLALNLDAGMSPQQAYEMMRAQTDPPKQVQDQRDLQYSKSVQTATDKNPKLANNTVLASKLDEAANAHFWNKNVPAPATTPAMRGEYEELVKEFFTRTGKIDQAQDLAFQQVQKTWHTSDINGAPELIKWGPTQAEVPAMKLTIAQALKEHGITDDPSTVHLVESPRTSLSQGDRWNMLDAKGDLVLGKNNQPVEINKSYGQKPYEATLAKQKAADDAKKAAQDAAENARWKASRGSLPAAIGAGEAAGG